MSTDTKKLEGGEQNMPLRRFPQTLYLIDHITNSSRYAGTVSRQGALYSVPLEQFKRAFKTSQKHIEKEWAALATSANDHISKLDLDRLKSKEGEKPTREDALKVVDGLLGRFTTLKKKIQESKDEEELYAKRSRIRLEHLDELLSLPSQESAGFTRWSKTQLDRILVDYMLREGCFESAKNLAKEAGIQASFLQLVDVELFEQSKMIEDALERRSCVECLQWCKENNSALKKMKSNLEFNLRIQEYVELVRVQKSAEAIAYLRKHLAPASDIHLKEVQVAAALLAFEPDTLCGRYKTMFDESRWDQLIIQFRAENCILNTLTTQPTLHTVLQAGMAALKTPMCYQAENQNVKCPICIGHVYGALAEKLPNAHHVNSCLVCRISGEIMNEDNLPMALPNGYVYSQKALEEMALKHDGIVTCPRTGSQFHFIQARKAFAI
ncbi:GID complex subunit containing RING finger motif [Physocladia obscura]|uniref:GID complex subunit containing RING finger motif n=1 Tax=Physocladia obscura TaxID=109957 RepID=A0AAD5T155_9FUNG|nr:GID complex subunit containing RING finger motif [Physocladia obscura]